MKTNLQNGMLTLSFRGKTNPIRLQIQWPQIRVKNGDVFIGMDTAFRLYHSKINFVVGVVVLGIGVAFEVFFSSGSSVAERQLKP